MTFNSTKLNNSVISCIFVKLPKLSKFPSLLSLLFCSCKKRLLPYLFREATSFRDLTNRRLLFALLTLNDCELVHNMLAVGELIHNK